MLRASNDTNRATNRVDDAGVGRDGLKRDERAGECGHRDELVNHCSSVRLCSVVAARKVGDSNSRDPRALRFSRPVR